MSSPLREYLKQTGKSMRGTALEIGVEPHLFNSYAHGKRPNQRNAMKVALALGLDVRTLWPVMSDRIELARMAERRAAVLGMAPTIAFPAIFIEEKGGNNGKE